MEHWFDDLARTVAGGVSRRDALRRIGGGLAGGLLVALLPGPASAEQGGGNPGRGNDECAHFCNEAFPPGPQRGACKSAAARGRGPCFECGPRAPAGHPPLCGAVCCPPGQVCCGGRCGPPPGPSCCCSCYAVDPVTGDQRLLFCTTALTNVDECQDLCPQGAGFSHRARCGTGASGTTVCGPGAAGCVIIPCTP